MTPALPRSQLEVVYRTHLRAVLLIYRQRRIEQLCKRKGKKTAVEKLPPGAFASHELWIESFNRP